MLTFCVGFYFPLLKIECFGQTMNKVAMVQYLQVYRKNVDYFSP